MASHYDHKQLKDYVKTEQFEMYSPKDKEKMISDNCEKILNLNLMTMVNDNE